MKILLKNGYVMDASQGIEGVKDIYIEDGRIAAVEKNIERAADQTVDVQGKYVIPGIIDMHVHLREPGYEYKETIATGTRSAAKGGVTSLACMPNTKPVIDQQATVEFVKNKAQLEGMVHVYPVGAITNGLQGERLTEIGDLKAAGIVAITDDGNPVMNGEKMRHAMEYAKMFELPVLSHCEDKNLAAHGVINEGRMSTLLGLKGMPAIAESIMVAREIMLSELTGAHVHVCHVSTAQSVEMIRRAKAAGLPVTAEAMPHHFALDETALHSFDTNLKVNPPLRRAEDVAAIKEGLRDGTIEVIATDHAPHAIEEKEVEFDNALFGISGLETLIPLVITELVHKGTLTFAQAIEKMTVNPARILGINKGTLKAGVEADITIIDLDQQKTVDVSQFASKGKNSPFHGWNLKGWPIMTIVSGKIVMKNGELV